jgi:hypothetical protein
MDLTQTSIHPLAFSQVRTELAQLDGRHHTDLQGYGCRRICRDTDVGELSLHTALRSADQVIRWAKFTMNPSGPRTDAMRQVPSY